MAFLSLTRHLKLILYSVLIKYSISYIKCLKIDFKAKLYILLYLYKIKINFINLLTFFRIWHYNKTIKGLRPTQKGPLAGSVVNMTKKQQAMLWNVTHSTNESLYDVYKSFSDSKYRAYDYCKYEMHLKDGFNFRITAANCHFFCCGFLYYDENKHLRCRYYTGRNIYDFIAE